MVDIVKYCSMDEGEKTEFLAGLSEEEFEVFSDELFEISKVFRDAIEVCDKIEKRLKKDELFVVILWRKIKPAAKAKADAEMNSLRTKMDSIIKNERFPVCEEIFNLGMKITEKGFPYVNDPSFPCFAVKNAFISINIKVLLNERKKRNNQN